MGLDRCGIVSDMTKLVTDAGGNVGESQASKLGTHFALTMLIQVPSEKVGHLETHLQGMSDLNASVFMVSEDQQTDVVHPKVACKLIDILNLLNVVVPASQGLSFKHGSSSHAFHCRSILQTRDGFPWKVLTTPGLSTK